MFGRRASCLSIVLGLGCILSAPALAQDAASPAPTEAAPPPSEGSPVTAEPAEAAPAPAPSYPTQPSQESEALQESDIAPVEEDLHRIGLFASPLSLIFGVLPIELDVRVAHSLTLNAQVQYISLGDFSGFGLAGGAQWFFTDKAFHGGYLFPNLQYASISGESADGESTEASAVGIGATLGYQWLWGAFGLRLGGGLVYYSASASNSSTSVSLDGVRPALDLSLGASF